MQQTLTRSLILLAAIAALTGCAGMTQNQRNAAIGGVAGSVLTGGDTLGTLGGAAVGGVIGNGGIK